MERVPSWKITSENQHNLMAYKKNRQSEVASRQRKSYFHFLFNTNSGGFFPIFDLKPQSNQIWADNYLKSAGVC